MPRQHNLDDMGFAEISEQARMRISEYFPQWNDLNTHDPGVTLIELFAWLTEQQRFHMNQSEGADSFFPLLGIALLPACAAAAEVEIAGGFPPRLIPANTPLYAEHVRFETAEETQYHGTPLPVPILQRETIGSPIPLGHAPGHHGACFTVDTKGQIILELSLAVAGEQWTRTDSFHTSRPGDRHYMLNGQTGEIIFGDGIHGAIPYGPVTVTSMVLTRGLDGNIAPNRLTELLGLPVSQPRAAAGGSACETAEQALHRFAASHRQAVTAGDIEQLVLETPGLSILCARAFDGGIAPQPGAPRVIQVAVKLRDGALTETAKGKIREQLEPYRLVCRDFHIAAPKTAHVSLQLAVRTGPHSADFTQRLAASIRAFFAHRCSGFGAVLRILELRALAADMPEVLEITRCAFRVSGGARISANGDIALEPDVLAELGEISIRTL